MVDRYDGKVVVQEDGFSSTDICKEYPRYLIDDYLNLLLLVDCEKGICKKTIGYVMEEIKEGHYKLFKYYEIDGKGVLIDYSVNGGINGELKYVAATDTVSVEIGNGNMLSIIENIDEKEKDKRYGIKKGVISMFNEDINVVKRGKYNIVKDVFYNFGE